MNAGFITKTRPFAFSFCIVPLKMEHSHLAPRSCDIATSVVGQRLSILLRILSANEIESAMVLSSTGEGRPSQWANLRAARIAAAMRSTRLRPSSTCPSYAFAFCSSSSSVM
jgi:hypothetical protein